MKFRRICKVTITSEISTFVSVCDTSYLVILKIENKKEEKVYNKTELVLNYLMFSSADVWTEFASFFCSENFQLMCSRR